MLESVLVPDFEHDDLALFAGQGGERTHGGGFGGFPGGGELEPTSGFQFAGEAPPDAAAIVQGAVAVAAEAIVFGFLGDAGGAQERHERLLEDIFGFIMGEAEGAAVQEEESGLGVIELFTPAMVIDGFAHPWFSPRLH